MIINTKDVFTVAGPTTTGRPYINETQIGALSVSSTFLADKRTLMNWIKRTPEAIGILRSLSQDVITKLHFVSMDTKTMGRPSTSRNKDNVDKAVQFARNNFLKQTLRAATLDHFGLGDGYIWKGIMNKVDLDKAVSDTLKECGIKQTTDIHFKEISSKALDENFNKERMLEYVPASTMDIEIDPKGTFIKSYIQRTTFTFGNQTFPTQRFNSFQGTSLNKSRVLIIGKADCIGVNPCTFPSISRNFL